MAVLIAGLILFLGTHSTRIVAPGLRERVVVNGGERAWRGLYTLLSLIGLVLIIWGYGLARQDAVILYQPAAGMRHLALLLLLPVLPLLFASHMPGRIKAAVGHPMLAATVLWGIAHLLANGTLADLLLFGGVAGWAAVDWVSSVRHPRKPVTSRAPSLRNDVISVIGGLAVYGILVGGLHELLIGVSPI